MDEYYQAIQSLPAWLAHPLQAMPSDRAGEIHELRLRVGCAPLFTAGGRILAPQEFGGELTQLQTLRLTPQQMEEILFTLCSGSVHTHQAEIAQGYVTLSSGCRAGLGGQYVRIQQQGIVLQELTSVNLRIAREMTIAIPEELRTALQGHFIGMLLVGEPGSGKTTVLRSIAQELVCQKKLVSVIDERRELFAGRNRKKLCGEALDLVSGIPKGMAVQIALRTLSPQVIVLDELGSMEEVSALEQGFFSGVDFIATLHAAALEEAAGRPQVQELFGRGMLHILVLLEGRTAPGQIREVRFI